MNPEANFEAIVDSGEPTIVLKPVYRDSVRILVVTYVNAEAIRQLSLTQSSIDGLPIEQILADFHQFGVARRIEKLLDNGGVIHATVSIKRGGNFVPAHLLGRCLSRPQTCIVIQFNLIQSILKKFIYLSRSRDKKQCLSQHYYWMTSIGKGNFVLSDIDPILCDFLDQDHEKFIGLGIDEAFEDQSEILDHDGGFEFSPNQTRTCLRQLKLASGKNVEVYDHAYPIIVDDCASPIAIAGQITYKGESRPKLDHGAAILNAFRDSFYLPTTSCFLTDWDGRIDQAHLAQDLAQNKSLIAYFSQEGKWIWQAHVRIAHRKQRQQVYHGWISTRNRSNIPASISVLPLPDQRVVTLFLVQALPRKSIADGRPGNGSSSHDVLRQHQRELHTGYRELGSYSVLFNRQGRIVSDDRDPPDALFRLLTAGDPGCRDIDGPHLHRNTLARALEVVANQDSPLILQYFLAFGPERVVVQLRSIFNQIWTDENCCRIVISCWLGKMSEGEDPELLAFKAIANVIGGGILVLNSELRIISASLGSGAYFREDPSILRGQPIANILGLRNGGNSSIEASIREAPSKNNKIVSALALGEHHRLPVDVRINRIDYRNEYGFVLTLREALVGREILERTGELAHFDSLTGLPNRALFVERLIHAIARAEHDEHELTIVLVDLVRFGLINESLGLKKGDQLIKEAAQKLGQSLRQGDIVARLSGDQFIVLLDGIGSTELALQVSEKVLKEFRHPIRINGHEVSLHINIGISLYPADGSEADALIRNANSALEKAKQLGEYRFCFFTSDMNAFAYERLVLEGDMKKAIEEGQFRLHYQPIYKLTDFSIVGFEALMRWFHPTQGLIPPLEFIPIAEDTGRIEELGREAIKLACSDLVRWYDAGFSDARVAVNVSARQLVDPTLPDQIRLMLERNHLEGSALDLEITESALIQATENSRRTFDRLREVGASISIDDFGTGYSSIRTLRDYPIDCLKIDRSLIAAITNAPQESDRASGFAIARAIVALGEGLKIRVIAEGVETEAQLEAVRELGCEEAQGFLLGRPMPFDQTLDVLRFPNQLTLLSDE